MCTTRVLIQLDLKSTQVRNIGNILIDFAEFAGCFEV